MSKREVDDDQVKVKIKYYSDYQYAISETVVPQTEMTRGAVVVATSKDDYEISEGVP
jgi:hypothetical protein